MLVLLVAVAIIGSFVVEIVLHHLGNTYEIEWVPLAVCTETDMAQEIVRTLRESRREDERQMNATFKVASDARW